MQKKRPVNLDLTTIRFPVTAFASILHRISGVVLFLLLPFIIWLLHVSLTREGFDHISAYLNNPIFKLFFWAIVGAYFYHLLGGIRHLLMDMGIGESLLGGTISAWLVILLASLLIILTGIWIWFII